MKKLLFLSSILLCGSMNGINAQDNVTVNVTSVKADTKNRKVGINTNYLMDDDANRTATRPLASALSDMKVRYIRYPGGEKSDANLWSIPPYDRSIPTLARTGPEEWPSGDPHLVQPDYKTFKIDPLDFDEFISICRQAGAEPVIVVCMDSMYKPATTGGTAPTRDQLLTCAREWVRYANITKGYGVKYWEIGNESFQFHYNGGTTASSYAADVVAFSKAMKAVDPSIKIGANGGNTSAWWQTVLQTASAHIDF